MIRALAASTMVIVSPQAAAAACAWPSAAGVAFEAASPAAPLMVVAGQIGDAPADIVFDTGASAPFPVFLSERAAERLGLTLSAEIAPPSTTAIGSARQTYRTGRLPSFTLGPVRLKDAQVAVTPMIDAMERQLGRRIDAIVGHHLVAERVIAIDYAAGRINLAAPTPDAASSVGVELAPLKPLAMVRMTVNGRGPFLMEIDTGATTTSLSPRAAAKAGVKAQSRGRMGGAGGAVDVGVGRGSAELGKVSRDLRAIAITPAVDQVGAAAGAALDGIIGGDFFAGACLTLDYPGRRLWVSRP
jgi:predicted aspartyl protease